MWLLADIISADYRGDDSAGLETECKMTRNDAGSVLASDPLLDVVPPSLSPPLPVCLFTRNLP